MSMFSTLHANAKVRMCPFLSGAIFEYTGSDLDNLRNALDEFIEMLSRYKGYNIKLTQVVEMVDEKLRKNNFKFWRCNDIYANQSLIRLICQFSKETQYGLDYSSTYKYLSIFNKDDMNPKKLTVGAEKLKEFLIGQKKYFCMCANLTSLVNYVNCSNMNLEYLIDENRTKFIIESMKNPFLIEKIVDFSNPVYYIIK